MSQMQPETGVQRSNLHGERSGVPPVEGAPTVTPSTPDLSNARMSAVPVGTSEPAVSQVAAQTNAVSPAVLIAEDFHRVTENLRVLLGSEQLPPVNGTLEETASVLDREIAREQLVEQHIQALGEIVQQVDRQIVAPAKKEFQSVTGLFDNYPTAVAAVSGLSGLATFTLGAYLAITHEHAILHGCSEVVHALLGNGPLSYIAASATAASVLFLQGLACLGGSLVGPSIVGLVKTAGGRFCRNFIEESQDSFEEKGARASELREQYLRLVDAMAKDISEIQPMLSKFYSQNEEIRLAISGQVLTSLSSEDPEVEKRDTHTAIHHRASALGAAELLTLMKSLNLERSIRGLAQKDFRSPELIAAAAGATETTPRGIGIVRGLKMALNFFPSLLTSSATIGHHSALGATLESREIFEKLPKNVVTDVVSGMGSGLSTTLQMALESGLRPDKTTYAFVKTVIGGAKSMLVGGLAEGPKLETFLKVVFELDELEKGNRVRWFSKLVPCLIRAATQKPALMERAEQVEALSGNVSPKSISSEIAEREGRLASLKKMASEVIKLFRSTLSEAAEQYLYVKPLDSLNKSPIIQRISPALSRWAGNRLYAHEVASEAHLQKLMDADLENLPDGGSIARLTDSELDLFAIQKYIEYSYRNDSTVTQKEMSSLIHYWTLRRKATWHRDKDTEAEHLAELVELGPQFRSLHKILHTESGLLSKVTRALIRGDEAGAVSTEREVPLTQQLFKKWHAQYGGQIALRAPTVIDCTADGLSVAVVDGLGRTRLLAAGELRELMKESGPSAGLAVLAHADDARITASEMMLAIRLEPFQRRALLEAHYGLITDQLTIEEAVSRLEQHSFSREQLLGIEGASGENQFPGLINLGLLGKRSHTPATPDS